METELSETDLMPLPPPVPCSVVVLGARPTIVDPPARKIRARKRHETPIAGTLRPIAGTLRPIAVALRPTPVQGVPIVRSSWDTRATQEIPVGLLKQLREDCK
jgi:hypothetical protein